MSTKQSRFDRAHALFSRRDGADFIPGSSGARLAAHARAALANAKAFAPDEVIPDGYAREWREKFGGGDWFVGNRERSAPRTTTHVRRFEDYPRMELHTLAHEQPETYARLLDDWRERGSPPLVATQALSSTSPAPATKRAVDYTRMELAAIAQTDRPRFERLMAERAGADPAQLDQHAARATSPTPATNTVDEETAWDRFVARQGGIQKLQALATTNPDAFERTMKAWRAEKAG